MGTQQPLLTGGGDPFWGNVVLLLTADGTGIGGTAFTDKSKYANTLTTVGGAICSAAQSIVGGKSIYYPDPPINSAITFNGSQSHFDFNTGSVTIECFRYIPIGEDNAFVFRFGTNGGNAVASYMGTSTHNVSIICGPTVLSSSSGYTFEGNVWRHEALQWDCDTTPGTTYVSFYCNGLRYLHNTYAVAGPGFSLAGTCAIGGRVAAAIHPLNGWQDQFRVTKGARYKGASYVVPSVPFFVA